MILEKDEAPLAGITAPNHMTADIGPPFVPRWKSPASAVPRESWERPTRVLVRKASDQIPDQGGVASRTEENVESTQHSEEQLDHEVTVVARAANSMPRSAQTTDFTMR